MRSATANQIAMIPAISATPDADTLMATSSSVTQDAPAPLRATAIPVTIFPPLVTVWLSILLSGCSEIGLIKVVSVVDPVNRAVTFKGKHWLPVYHVSGYEYLVCLP